MFGEKRKPVSFNLDDPVERRLYEWAQTFNFSGYVKDRMIQEIPNDDDGWSQPVQHIATHSERK